MRSTSAPLSPVRSAVRSLVAVVFLVALGGSLLQPGAANAHPGGEDWTGVDCLQLPPGLVYRCLDYQAGDHDWDDDWGQENPDEVTEPVEPEPVTTSSIKGNSSTFTIASVNINRYMRPSSIIRDRSAIMRRSQIDIIGWQEADRNRDWFDGVDGWRTVKQAGSAGVPISFRQSTFELVGSRVERLNSARSGRRKGYHWTARAAHVVQLRHRATGKVVTVINAHIVPAIESHAQPGTPANNANAQVARRAIRKVAKLYRTADGTVVGTGDFNWNYAADLRVQNPKYVQRIGQYATSSYEALGLGAVAPTHGSRYIDYVWLGRQSAAAFVKHKTLGGYRSDHRPLLAAVELH